MYWKCQTAAQVYAVDCIVGLIDDAIDDIADYAVAIEIHTPTIVATWQDVDLPLYVPR